MTDSQSYDLMGYTYLSDGVWGYVFLDSGSKENMQEAGPRWVDGCQFTDFLVVPSDEYE